MPRCRRTRRVRAFAMACVALVLHAMPVAVVRGDVVRELTDPVLRLDLPGHTSDVRALAFFPDSTRLVSGGRDKVAMIWNLGGQVVGDRVPGAEDDGAGDDKRLTRDIARRRVRESVLRWQVARATRGAIQALAVSAGESPVVALAGSGAMGSNGEILLLDAADGTLVAVLGGGEKQGHRSSVAALDFSSDGTWLFSQDFAGQAFAWRKGERWAPVELAGREEDRYGPRRAAALERRPALRPLAAVTGGVALPVLVSPEGAESERWRIDIVDPREPARRRRLSTEHVGLVMALDATPDGRRLVSADLAGNVLVWDLGVDDPQPSAFRVTQAGEKTRAAESVAIAPDGLSVAIGISESRKDGARPRLEIWDVKKAAMRRAVRDMPAAVHAVCFSPDGTRLAWSGGWNHEVFVASPDAVAPAAEAQARGAPRRLGGVGRRIGRVAFASARDGDASARIALAFEEPDGPRGWDTAFQLRGLALAPPGAEADWAPPAGAPAGWSLGLDQERQPGHERWRLARGGVPAGLIDIDLSWQGRLGPVERCVAWLARQGAAEPWAVAVGTDRGIFIHELVAQGSSPLVRWYRGHEDGVRSLAVSPDMRWLASGGNDGIVMLWPLAGVGEGRPLFERFGLSLKVEDGKAVVESIDEAGPLAGRDVRVGDVLDKIVPGEGEKRIEVTDGKAVLVALTDCPWDAQPGFFTSRDGKAAEPFNRRPAWENAAALHLAANREWAFWSPRGYYAASANGDTLFGWLQNRGIDKLPRFFRAAQFRRRLERPDAMSRLFETGSIGAALRNAVRDIPESSGIVLPRLLAATPDVRILSPSPAEAVDGATVRVAARVEIPVGVEVSTVKAYASGVSAGRPPRKVVRPADGERPLVHEYEWDLALPAESRHLVQVFVGTNAGTTDVGEVAIVAPAAARTPTRRPRLHILSAGVDRFLHADRLVEFKLAPLAYAAKDARAIRDRLVNADGSLYEVASDGLLIDDQVTRDGWRAALAKLGQGVASGVGPDDVIVVFLAGHGLVDAEGGRGYSYLCHDADLIESHGACVPRDGVVTWKDFELLADIPCRKIALVDTCHAGALGPASRGTALRDFQENMILVLAAAADDESSLESDSWGHGAFTRALLDVLGSSGGAAADGIVTLDEVVDHVVAAVPGLTGGDDAGRGGDDPSAAQHPTVSPAALVPYMSIPLSAAASSGHP